MPRQSQPGERREAPTGTAKAVLKVAEAAARLGLSYEQVIGLIDEGQLLSLDVGNGRGRRQYRIPVAAIERYESQRRGGKNR
jgi:excisionase family DNA binding protein